MQDGTRTDEIVYNESTTTSYKPVDGLVSRLVQCFKYRVKTDVNPSVVTLNGKRVIVPVWLEVHPLTTINDIEWVKPKPKRQNTKTTEVTSESGTYKVKFNPDTKEWKCNCFGFFRLKDRSKGCKHIIQAKSQN